ncbi:MAG: anthranilate phosphoribosyltransferase [Peptococcaceae bacterium]|nr:anthranilate phosphoribosyltransferase [Peptococcaceae bacterium]
MNFTTEAIQQVVEGTSLSTEQAMQVMEEIMSGQATGAQIGALLTALRLKGETVEEITGFVRIMRQKAAPMRPVRKVVVDTCGTGGDGLATFNISTTAGLVLAGAGVTVAKHGNRSVSSRSGSADVLEALGVRMDLGADMVADSMEKFNFGFLFAPAFHASTRFVAGPRREIGIRTVFNILGPLTNPAGASRQVVGVYSERLVPLVAGVLAATGSHCCFVVHGHGGMDEVSTAGPALVAEVRDGRVRTFRLDPLELGLPPCDLADLAGGSPQENAAIVRRILAGERGPRRDTVLLNAALGFMAAGACPALADGLAMAAAAIDSQAAAANLEELARFSQLAREAV